MPNKTQMLKGQNSLFPSNFSLKAVIKNVVRGFSLVLHDPEGSHYKIVRRHLKGRTTKFGKARGTEGVISIKFQMAKSKSQIPNKFQISNSKCQINPFKM
jgi:hypothetical protein